MTQVACDRRRRHSTFGYVSPLEFFLEEKNKRGRIELPCWATRGDAEGEPRAVVYLCASGA